MVASDGTGGGQGPLLGGGIRTDGPEAGTALSKLKHTLTSGIHGTVTKLSPTRSGPNANQEGSLSSSSSSSSAGVVVQPSQVSSEERSLLQKVWEKNERFDATDGRVFKPPPITTPTAPSVGGGSLSPVSSPVGSKQVDGGSVPMPTRPHRAPGSSCRVCVKTLGESEFYKICSECGNKVCEDCASYSTHGTETEEKWNCSICRRRLSSRVKNEQQQSGEGTSLSANVPPIMASPLPTPTPGAPPALNLFSGIAAMASTMASTQSNQPASANAISAAAPPSGTSSVSAVPPSLANQVTTTPSTPTTGEPPATNGLAHRRSMKVCAKQRSLDKAKTVERSRSRDDSRDRRPPSALPGDGRRPRDKSRERAPVPRRRSDNDEEPPRVSSRASSVRRGRMSDYMLRDAADGDHLNFQRIHAAHSETDVSRSRKPSYTNLPMNRPVDTTSSRTSVEDAPQGRRESESSGDEALVTENWHSRGRRRSIIRQQSYEEEDAESETFVSASSNSLTLWGTGELPARRHSAQDPARRDDSLEGRRTRDSLDVPQHSRVHRHHSWDYDVSRDTLPITGIVASVGSSRHSSESDVSSEAASERGSTTALTEDRRFSRSSVKRRSSYRASRVKNHDLNDPYDADDQSGPLDSSPSPLSPEIPLNRDGGGGGGGGGTALTSGPSSPRRSGTSSLDDEHWLHPTDDEWRTGRRRSSNVSDSGRMLPTPPTSPRSSYQTAPTPPLVGGGGGGVLGGVVPGPGSDGRGSISRITQSLEVNTSRDLSIGSEDGLKRQSSVTEGETIRIVIHDVDLDHRKAPLAEKGRRVKIQRDMSDTAHRTRGLGMRVVGGKVGSDGRLFAYVVWTVRGGPAEAAGVLQGDKVLEWNGLELTDRSFEEVCSIMDDLDPQEDTVDLLLESSNDLRSLDHGDDPSALIQQKKGSLEGRIPSEADDKSQSSARRKLPRIPGDQIREPVTGKLQIQLWYDQDKSHLIVTVVSAHDLRFRDSSSYCPPEAFVCLRLYPFADCKLYSTGVAESSCKPLWNSSFIWEGLTGDSLMALTLELSVWDYVSDTDNGFLGETLIDLRHAYLDERPIWYRLQERRSRSANATPRGSIASYDFTAPSSVRRPSSVRSGSDDVDADDSRNSSLDSGLLHPDLAWRESRSPSRRGSSLSEQAENEVYQLSRSYPHSLPQSRRSSVAYQSSSSPEFKAEDLEERLTVSASPIERRRSHSFRASSRGEFAAKASDEPPRARRATHSALTRSHSLKAPHAADHRARKGVPASNRQEDETRAWSVTGDHASPDLGPGQVVPRGYRDILTDDFTLGEIRLALTLTKGQLEVEVSSARGLPTATSGQDPDTYVKMYLRDGEKRLQKRKTRVARHSRTPKYHQTLRYTAHDALGRSLLVMVWERQRGFEHNQAIGVAEISLSKLERNQPLEGWYRLLPVTSVMREDSDSADSVR